MDIAPKIFNGVFAAESFAYYMGTAEPLRNGEPLDRHCRIRLHVVLHRTPRDLSGSLLPERPREGMADGRPIERWPSSACPSRSGSGRAHLFGTHRSLARHHRNS
jgi:hypothetical protein